MREYVGMLLGVKVLGSFSSTTKKSKGGRKERGRGKGRERRGRDGEEGAGGGEEDDNEEKEGGEEREEETSMKGELGPAGLCTYLCVHMIYLAVCMHTHMESFLYY